jgi:hypothetical protein
MPTLHIEHHVADYDTWKRHAFDADPLARAASGVRKHRISRSADDPNYLIIELEFASLPEAEAMQAVLRNLWRKPLVQISGPTARIIETVEAKDY